VSRRTEMSYKAESLGKAAQHVKALDSGDTVNGAVVQWRFTPLSGETCFSCGFTYLSVELPEGATGNQMSRRFQECVPAWKRGTKPVEQTDRWKPELYRATCMVRKQESAEAILAKCRE
jgi:hypothetical protein